MTESESFSRAVMPHSRRLYAVAFRFLQRSDEAEDAVQDVLVKLWQIRTKLPSGGELLPFMMTVTRNLCIDRLRARKEVEDCDELQLIGEEEAHADTRVDDHDNLQQMMRLINHLPPDQQRVLKLRVFNDLSTEQIAKLLNIKNDNVRQLLSRARRSLKEQAIKQRIV